MKKYYRHTLLYLHETISLGSGRSDRFTEVFTDTYQPMMDDLGARLFATLGIHPVQRSLAAGHDHLGDRRVRRLRQDRGGAGARWQP